MFIDRVYVLTLESRLCLDWRGCMSALTVAEWQDFLVTSLVGWHPEQVFNDKNR